MRHDDLRDRGTVRRQLLHCDMSTMLREIADNIGARLLTMPQRVFCPNRRLGASQTATRQQWQRIHDGAPSPPPGVPTDEYLLADGLAFPAVWHNENWTSNPPVALPSERFSAVVSAC